MNFTNSKALVWHLYIVRTKHGQLYTGVTQDIARRFIEHQEGGKKAAKYLRGKGPLELVFQLEIGNRSSALKAEIAIKKLPKRQKENLTKNSARFNTDTLKTVQNK